MENQSRINQLPLYLIYSRAIDLRICLILSSIGLAVRPISNIAAFLETFPNDCDGIVLIDVDSEHESGVTLVEQLMSRLHQPFVIPICANGSIDFCRKCFMAGAVDVLDKSFNDQVITDALQVSLGISSLEGARRLPRIRRRERFAMLTNREREIFSYIADGLSNREIGQTLSLSPRTVECHRAHLNEKLDARNLAHMVRQYGPFLDEVS